MEGAQVLVDAERDPHPLDPQLGGGPGLGLGSEQHAMGAGLGDAEQDRLIPRVYEAMEDRAPKARQAVEPRPARQAKR